MLFGIKFVLCGYTFLLVSAVVYGQTPAGYIKANMRFKWTAGIFDSALHVPQYNGTPSGIRNGAWVGDGAVAVDTVIIYFIFVHLGLGIQRQAALVGFSQVIQAQRPQTSSGRPMRSR